MALVLARFELTAQLLGEKSANRTKSWEIAVDPGAADDNAAAASALTEATALIAAFAAITDAEILSYGVRAVYEENAAVIVPADADLYTEAFLTVGLDAAGFKKGTHSIPAPSSLIFTGDDETTQTIDNVDPLLVAYLTRFAAPNFTRISDGEEILSLPRVRASRVRSVSSGKRF